MGDFDCCAAVGTRELSLKLSDAAICRRNGWVVGTELVGDEGFGPTVIRLTAIGEKSILARAISRRCEPVNVPELTWTLSCRDWSLVSSTRRNQP